MKNFIYEFSRLFGLIMFWVGICCFAYYAPIAISVIIASLFIMPWSFYFFFKNAGEVMETIRIFLIIGFLAYPSYVLYRSFTDDPLYDFNAMAHEEVQEYQHQKELKRYFDNKERIIKGIRHYFDQGNYRFAYAHADEFMYTNDPELVELHEKAKQKMIEKGEFKDPKDD